MSPKALRFKPFSCHLKPFEVLFSPVFKGFPSFFSLGRGGRLYSRAAAERAPARELPGAAAGRGAAPGEVFSLLFPLNFPIFIYF